MAAQAKLKLPELSTVLQEANLLDKGDGRDAVIPAGSEEEEEREEDTQIQSSLPFYLDHMFGGRVGCSQNELQAAGTASPLSSQSALGDSQVVSVMETPLSPSSADGPPPLKLCDPVHSSPVTVGCRSQPLFLSPSNGDSNQEGEKCGAATAGRSDIGEFLCLNVLDMPKPLKNTSAKHAVPSRKRQRSRRKGTEDSIEDGYCCPPSCLPLAQCTAINKTVNLIALVMQVNLAMDVICRKSFMAGQTVQMSSLLLSDPSHSYFKLSLWRGAAAWAERIAIGDIVYFKNVRLKVWKNEFVGTTNMHSSVLNLHQPSKQLPAKVLKFIPEKSVADLLRWGKARYGYLFVSRPMPKSQREVKFQTSRESLQEPVMHCRAKLLQLISPRVALFVDQPGLDIHLHLLGATAALWASQLTGGIGQVWELMYVAVLGEESQTQNGVCTLQTTSRTRLTVLDPGCDAALEILRTVSLGGHDREDLMASNLTIADILTKKSSGTFKIKAIADSIKFICPEGSCLPIETMVTLSPSEIVSRLCQAVYVGCESCSQPLLQDENGIYCQCMPCIMKSPGGGYPASSYFFRPLLVIVRDSSMSSITLTASQGIVPKVLGWTGRDVVQASLSSKPEMIRAWRLKELFGPSHWVVNCVAVKDENSFLQELSFSIVDVNTTLQ